MDRKPPAVRDGQVVRFDRDPVLSFVETGEAEPRPRLLVDRLLYARVLLQASDVLAPRFELGDCAAAHHIVLGGGMGLAATERLMAHGFRVEPSVAPPGIRFFLSSAHSEAEIRALIVAITRVVRELAEESAASSRCRMRAPSPAGPK